MPLIATLAKHKVATSLVVILVAGGGLYAYHSHAAKPAATTYVTQPAQIGTLVVAVSGTGQVSSSNQIDVKPQASGLVAHVAVQNGQTVRAGDLLVQLDARDALKTVRDAQINLQSAKLSLTKLQQPADAYTILQAENSIQSSRNSLEKLKLSQANERTKAEETFSKATDDLPTQYEDAFNAIANTFLDLPTVINATRDQLYSDDIQNENREDISGEGVENHDALVMTTPIKSQQKLEAFIGVAETDFATANDTHFKPNFANYKASNRFASHEAIETLLTETIETTKRISQAAKSSSNMLDTWVGYRSQTAQTVFSTVTNYQNDLSSYITQTNSHLSSLLSAQKAIEDSKQSIADAQRDLNELAVNGPFDLAASEQTVHEKEASLEDLKKGPDDLDLTSQQITITQRQNSLNDAYEKLADYSVLSPIEGTATNVAVRFAESVSSGTAIATIVANQKIAEVSLNEVDVAKVKVGQKATLTFDAIEDLSISGTVSEIDLLGAVSQGVVSYSVKIAFDTQDDRIKPGMSVSANIITEAKQDVLLVPNSAVKTQGQESYVETLVDGVPQRVTVQTGLSDDTSTEIVSGLEANTEVVTQTITSSSTATATTGTRAGTGIPGLGGLGGGNATFRGR